MSTTGSDVTRRTDGGPVMDAAPASVVRRFLEHLAAGDLDAASDLLGEDVDYTNVSLPTIRGRERVRRALESMMRLRGAGFEVYFHAMSSDGGSVLTERTDVLTLGRFRMQFWVCGRFDVRDGEIVLWRDYFDWLNITVALVRGLLGAIVPSLRAKPPASI